MTYTTNSTCGTYLPAALTVEKLLDIQRTLKTVAVDIPEIRESHHAVRRVQTRVYARRRAKSAAHHARMNKKWRKRYGETEVPAAFVMATSLLGGPRKIMFVHPELMKLVRQRFTSAVDRQFSDILGGLVCFSEGKAAPLSEQK